MKLKNKSILVTGGAGFIGSHLVDRLVHERPEKIIVASSFWLGKLGNLSEAKKRFDGLKVVRADVANYQRIRKVVVGNGIDVVFNLSVIPLITSLQKPEWTFRRNVDMTANICRLCREDKFKSLIQYSSSEAYGTARHVPMSETHPLNPETPYAASKAATDHLALSYARTFGMDVRVVRPFNTYGPRQNLGKYAGVIPLTLRRIINNEPVVIQGDGKQTRDFIYVSDTADATVRIAKSQRTRHEVINVASGKETSMIRIMNLLVKYTGYRKKFRYVKARPGDVRRHCGDISKARKLIGFKPSVSIEQGLKLTADWYMSNPGRI
jgi:UDP-glucose 4-epimerase